jgi:phosphatidylserine/phosphatidylglycerophosphate/cardiolipin synthase-like enzyme
MGKKYTYIHIYIYINGGFNQKLIYKSGVSNARFDYRRVYTYMYSIYVYIYIILIYIHQLYRLRSTFYWFLHQYFAVGFPNTMLVPIPVSAVS